MKKTIQIKCPDWVKVEPCPWAAKQYGREWPATYEVAGVQNVRYITIEARSLIEVVVALHNVQNKLFGGAKYYISSPNFNVAIPYTPELDETHWITEKLLEAEMNAPDAVTVAQVLRDMGNF